jgi:hypothetical protein
MASIIDYILEEDQANYAAIIERAAEAKANAPKAPRAPRGPMSIDKKIELTAKKLVALQEKLEALRAQE